jgi:predicted metal-dependent hydrolase
VFKKKRVTEPVQGRILLQNKIVDYTLKYSPRARYMRLQVHIEKGLEVIVPRGLEKKEAENFILRKEVWILKHLNVKKDRVVTKYLGNDIKIIQIFDLFITRHKISFKEGTLHITSPESSGDEIKIIFDAWLKHLGKKYLPARTGQLARKYGFNFNKVIIKGQKTRWGSCSIRKNLSFNYKLMKYRTEVIDYVIIHELCHLREMNHSKKFWALVMEICPDYKSLKKELKKL